LIDVTFLLAGENAGWLSRTGKRVDVGDRALQHSVDARLERLMERVKLFEGADYLKAYN
jgi:hypothetical protein